MKNQNLGKEAKDKITGFKGIITGHAEYLTGCDQYLIQPEGTDQTKYPEANWFDEGRVDFLKPKIAQEDVLAEENGSDYIAPVK